MMDKDDTGGVWISSKIEETKIMLLISDLHIDPIVRCFLLICELAAIGR